MTDTIGFGEALKAFRRGVHVYGPDWRGVILGHSVLQLAATSIEATRIFDGSSLIAKYDGSNQIFYFNPSGARLHLCLARDLTDAYCLSGHEYTQIIWMFTPDDSVSQYVHHMLRSPTVPHEKLRLDYSGL